ncbi:MAG: hypothetical protein DME19_14845 [Verrucomicrobia bacterium]|nr:MAG: hypothetical protein DME19_14845 [Verrucomicrobiota bacterium]
MKLKDFGRIKPRAQILCLLLSAMKTQTQGLLVDQASGTIGENIQNSITIPVQPTVQSFMPTLPGIGYIQLSTYIRAASSGVTVIINLRHDAYNGPIVSSTDPVIVVNKNTQISAFYFTGNIPVTPNQVYYFEPVVLSGGTWFVGYKGPSTYDRGDLFSNGVPSGGAVDLWFQEGIVVPEPRGVWLLLFGGSVLFWCRRIGMKS